MKIYLRGCFWSSTYNAIFNSILKMWGGDPRSGTTVEWDVRTDQGEESIYVEARTTTEFRDLLHRGIKQVHIN